MRTRTTGTPTTTRTTRPSRPTRSTTPTTPEPTGCTSSSARDRLRDRIETFTAALEEAGAAYTTPEGAFYVLARFEDFRGTMANVKTLIDEAGVAGMPGATFGTARESWFRFALVTPRVAEAADRLAACFESR